MEKLVRKTDAILDAFNEHIRIGNNRHGTLMFLHLVVDLNDKFRLQIKEGESDE